MLTARPGRNQLTCSLCQVLTEHFTRDCSSLCPTWQKLTNVPVSSVPGLLLYSLVATIHHVNARILPGHGVPDRLSSGQQSKSTQHYLSVCMPAVWKYPSTSTLTKGCSCNYEGAALETQQGTDNCLSNFLEVGHPRPRCFVLVPWGMGGLPQEIWRYTAATHGICQYLQFRMQIWSYKSNDIYHDFSHDWLRRNMDKTKFQLLHMVSIFCSLVVIPVGYTTEVYNGRKS